MWRAQQTPTQQLPPKRTRRSESQQCGAQQWQASRLKVTREPTWLTHLSTLETTKEIKPKPYTSLYYPTQAEFCIFSSRGTTIVLATILVVAKASYTVLVAISTTGRYWNMFTTLATTTVATITLHNVKGVFYNIIIILWYFSMY